MRVVVGLGNPGREYAATLHNIGFAVVEGLAARWSIILLPAGDVRLGEGTICGVRTDLVQPQGYMNRSGESLQAQGMTWRAEDLVVVHDDIDLPAGRLRFRRNGRAGGHRGVASVIACFGAEFDRLKVGVGRPPRGKTAADHVLDPAAGLHSQRWEAVVERADDALEYMLRNGIENAMDRFNRRDAV